MKTILWYRYQLFSHRFCFSDEELVEVLELVFLFEFRLPLELFEVERLSGFPIILAQAF